ncbi:hypothetical protein GCM10027093_12750 [Paraburkholderia jirisanensis]
MSPSCVEWRARRAACVCGLFATLQPRGARRLPDACVRPCQLTEWLERLAYWLTSSDHKPYFFTSSESMFALSINSVGHA